MNEALNPASLLTAEQAAAYLNVKPQTLATWRCTKRYGLPWVKVGRSVRYRLEDVKRFIEASLECPIVDNGGGA